MKIRILFTILLLVSACSATTYWVGPAPNCSDSWPGTSSLQPFCTISRATGSSGVVLPGDTVLVMDGVYVENVEIQRGGSNDYSRVLIKSQNKWGAQIHASTLQTYHVRVGTGASNTPSFVTIQDFEIYGGDASHARYGILVYGSYTNVVGNHIHHLYNNSIDTTLGVIGVAPGVFNGTSTLSPGPLRMNNNVYNNVIHDLKSLAGDTVKTGEAIYIQHRYNNAYNNIIYNCNRYCIHVNHQIGNNTVSNNIVSGSPNDGAIMIGVGGTNEPNVVGDNVVVTNNIILNSVKGLVQWADEPAGSWSIGGNTWSNNLFYNNTQNTFYDLSIPINQKISNTNPVTQDPKFYNTNNWPSDPSTANFHLQVGSPAIGAGTLLGAPMYDYDGNLRGSSIDIGVYNSTGSSGSTNRRTNSGIL